MTDKGDDERYQLTDNWKDVKWLQGEVMRLHGLLDAISALADSR